MQDTSGERPGKGFTIIPDGLLFNLLADCKYSRWMEFASPLKLMNRLHPRIMDHQKVRFNVLLRFARGEV